MDHPILVTVFLHRAPLFCCIDNRSEIACRDFPRHDDSAVGQLSALPTKADIRQRIEHVCFVPIARRFFGRLCAVMRTLSATFIVALAFCASASANWFNKSEQYLAGCQNEAIRRYYKDTSSEDVRRHIYLCMTAQGYVFRESCDEKGWVNPDCYRLKFKTEGR